MMDRLLRDMSGRATGAGSDKSCWKVGSWSRVSQSADAAAAANDVASLEIEILVPGVVHVCMRSACTSWQSERGRKEGDEWTGEAEAVTTTATVCQIR